MRSNWTTPSAPLSPSTWLVSITRNAGFQRLRERKNLESLDEVGFQEEEEFRPQHARAWQDNPEQLYSKVEMRKLVETGVMRLPAEYRLVVMLRELLSPRFTETAGRTTGL